MSGKHCGPSKGLLDLDAKIGSAMDDLQNSSIGTGAAGIADSISGLKANLKSKTDGILADIESAIPEIPKPKANLQEQMTKLMGNLDNPGALLSELEGIKGNFGANINVDEMLSNAGLDPSKLGDLSEELKGLQKKAKIQNAVGSLGRLAAGDLSAVKNLMGGLPTITLPGSDAASIIDGICKDVPNLDLDADGNVIKKGIETKVSTDDAEPVEEALAKNDTPPPAKDQAPADNLEESNTVLLNPDTDVAAKIEKELADEIRERMNPISEEYKVQFNIVVSKGKEAKEFFDEAGKFFEIGGRKARDENKAKGEAAQAEVNKASKEIIGLLFLIALTEKDINYNYNVKGEKAGLWDKRTFRKPTVTWDEIHEKTNFQNLTSIVDRILAIPSLEIKGERPQRVRFGVG